MQLINSIGRILGTKVLSLLLLLVLRVLTARLLGAADLGSIGNALNFSTIVCRWGTVGIAPATQFMTSKYASQRNMILTFVLVASIAISITNLVVLFYFEDKILEWQFASDHNGRSAYVKLIPWLPTIVLSMTLPIFLLGSGRIKAYSFTQTIPVFLQLLFIAILAYQIKTINLVLTSQIIYWLSTIMISILFIRPKIFPVHFDLKILKAFGKYAIKSWPQVILQFGIARFAVLAGAQFLSSQDLGFYLLASNLSESFLLLTTSLMPIVFNQVASRGSSPELLGRSLLVSNLSILFAFTASLFFAKPALLIVFGNEFAPSGDLLILLLISVLFQGMIRILSTYFAALSQNGIINLIQLLQLVLLIVTSYLICPVTGPDGLCYAAIVASVSGCVASLIAYRRIEGNSISLVRLFIPTKNDVKVFAGFSKSKPGR